MDPRKVAAMSRAIRSHARRLSLPRMDRRFVLGKVARRSTFVVPKQSRWNRRAVVLEWAHGAFRQAPRASTVQSAVCAPRTSKIAPCGIASSRTACAAALLASPSQAFLVTRHASLGRARAATGRRRAPASAAPRTKPQFGTARERETCVSVRRSATRAQTFAVRTCSC